jgi:predicted GH43/DUF377 family glycosyl hydrolase
VELGPDLKPVWPVRYRKLHPRHDRCAGGRDDPRLFVYRGRLHASFTGVEVRGESTIAHVLLARLGSDWQVEECWEPHYPKRAAWEKNWAFFDAGGVLHAVYGLQPHRVLRFDERGQHVAAEFETDARLAWGWGYLRGGAPPVKVGDEYWHWFHGALDHAPGTRTYTGAVVVFDADPASGFRVKRWTPEPVLLPSDVGGDPQRPVKVVFPAGALLEDGKWLVSFGLDDGACLIARYDHDAIERMLVPV